MKKHKLICVISIVVICIGMTVPSVSVWACGPFFPETYFIFTKHPDVPLDKFAAGELGILQPTYARSYLVVAYRYLNGAGLSKTEQAAAVLLWKQRFDDQTLYGAASYEDSTPAEAAWFRMRAKVPGVPRIRSGKDLLPSQSRGYWNYVEVSSSRDSTTNCLDPGFETATNTLQRRIRQFGLTSAAVQSWVGAQDAVFRLCDDSTPHKTPSFPVPADSSLPDLIRADRAYQIAAAHFYTGDYDGARERFRQISHDAHSPWRATGALMVARSMIRNATLLSPNSQSEQAGLREARSVLDGIVRDSSMHEMHGPAKNLLSFIDVRLNPVEYTHSLAQTLAQPNDANYRHDLDDYTLLLDKWLVPFDDPYEYKNGKKVKRFSGSPVTLLPNTDRTDPLTDWILTFQSGDASAFTHALESWRRTHSVRWLVAALAKLRPGNSNADELISAAKIVGPESPAYLSLRFHVLRIEAQSGRREEARQEIDTLLANQSKKVPDSVRNLLLSLRLSLAKDLDELLRYAPRMPVLVDTDENDIEMPNSEPFYHAAKKAAEKEDAPDPLFDVDAAWVFTRGLPTSLLAAAAEGEELPPKLRSAVARSAWVRAITIGDEENATRLAPIVKKLEPKLASEMEHYIGTTDLASRRFNGILTIMRTPGLRPFVGYGIRRETPIEKVDNYRDNWWCSLDDTRTRTWENGDLWSDLYSPINRTDELPLLAKIFSGDRFSVPSFLSPEQENAAESEWKQLNKREIGTVWLAKQALGWAKAHPDDSRAPEALHHAVRVLRYSCDDDGASNLSHEAFSLLHHKYPNSEWAKKTPFWFY